MSYLEVGNRDIAVLQLGAKLCGLFPSGDRVMRPGDKVIDYESSIVGRDGSPRRAGVVFLFLRPGDEVISIVTANRERIG